MDASDILKSCPLFSALPSEVFPRLTRAAHKQAYSKGVEIFIQGDSCAGFYVVAEGSVKVYRVSLSGRERILAIVRPGQSFGEAALFSSTDFPASAAALEDTLVLYLDGRELISLLEERPDASMAMLAGLSQWLRRMVNLLEDTALTEVDTRLARYLLRLAAATPLENKTGGRLRLPMKKHVLASHLATTAPTLSRSFGRLEDEGLIHLEGDEIYLLNLQGLQDRGEILLEQE